MLSSDDADKLERDLRTLIPVLVALAYREQMDSKVLAERVVKLVMRCARDPEPAPAISVDGIKKNTGSGDGI